MNNSRTISRNRILKVPVAKTAKRKQESLNRISIPREGVSSSSGCDRSREPNPTYGEEAEVAKDTCDVVPSDAKSVSAPNTLSVRFSDEQDKTKPSCKSSTNECNDDDGGFKQKSDKIIMNQKITGLEMDIKSKPSIDFSSLVYKNYPKKIAGIKVTKKFLLMSKGLKWKHLAPLPETIDSTNKENISNSGNVSSNRKEVITNPIDQTPEIIAEKPIIEKIKQAVEPQILVIDKDSKPDLQIVKTFCPRKQRKSNLKAIVSKYTPKTYVKWQLSPTHVNMNRHKDCATPVLKSVGRYSPANMGYHNSSHLIKQSVPSDSSEISAQVPYFKSTLPSNRRRCHSKGRTKFIFQTDEQEPAKKLIPCIRKKPKGFFKSSKENILSHIPSRIPISIKNSNCGHGYKSHSQSDESNEQISGIAAVSFQKLSRKPSLGKQPMKISFEEHFPERETSRSRDNVHKFHVVNKYSPRISVKDKIEGMPEPQSRNSSAKREAVKVDHNKHVQSLNRHHSTFQKDRGESMGCNTWKEKVVPLLEDSQTQKSGNSANRKLYRESVLDEKIDADVEELQNLIIQHRKTGTKIDNTGKSKVEFQDNIKSIIQDAPSHGEIKVLKSSFPYQSPQHCDEEQNDCCDSKSELFKERTKSSRERKEKCPTNKNSKEDKLPLSSKKELNKVLKILLKRQDADMAKNLFKYLMEESETNLNKEKIAENTLINKKYKSVLKNRSRDNSRSSISSPRRRRRGSRESSKSSSRNNSQGRRTESISPARTSKRIHFKQRDASRMDLHNKSDTSLFAEKVKTYKTLYTGSRDAVELISEPPNVEMSKIILPTEVLGNFSRESASPARRAYAENVPFKSEKPFRSWLKNNNLMYYDDYRESAQRMDFSPPELEESALYQNNSYDDNLDISYLFSAEENPGNAANYVFDQQYGFCSSPTEYFFNSLSEAGVNNNNTKHSVANVMQNPGKTATKFYSGENKSHNCRLDDEGFQEKSCMRKTGKYRIEPDKRLLSNLNRRHTKKPIKMSILPCSWYPENIHPTKSSSTISSHCSIPSPQTERPKKISWASRPEAKHSWSLISPDTIRSFSFDSDKSSIRLPKRNHDRVVFHL